MTLIEQKIIQSHFPVGSTIMIDYDNTHNIESNTIGKVIKHIPELDLIRIQWLTGAKAGVESSIQVGTDMFHPHNFNLV